MKTITLLLASMLLWACGGNAQDERTSEPATNAPTAARTTNVQGPMIEFDRKAHDYGTMQIGDDGSTTFKVSNTGDAPLIIKECVSGCGCTVPVCDKTPIPPGGSTDIHVTYDTKRPGRIHRTVTIRSNATNLHTVQLLIQGHVEGEEEPDRDGATH
jgi:hypothetical protein